MATVCYSRGGISVAERLRYYATQFDTADIDFTFYGIPAVRTAVLWAA
ncbi:MAG: DUF72 domain-containing protein [Actinobacteria bacterium]|nr:DUF72 domain-containing protein [Actinomycetota bacterium]